MIRKKRRKGLWLLALGCRGLYICFVFGALDSRSGLSWHSYVCSYVHVCVYSVGVGECKKELSVFGAGWCGLDVERERRRRNSGCSQRAVVCRARAGRLHHPATHGMRVSPAVRADEVCPVCEQGAAEDGRMVRCRSCRNPYHQVCVMHNPYLMHEEDFECGSENCPSPPPPSPCLVWTCWPRVRVPSVAASIPEARPYSAAPGVAVLTQLTARDGRRLVRAG
jgi:hypothetical protein